jgi:amidase
LKDNIETRDPVPTTAGSLALARNISERDAPVVARLRAAGVIILGKSNMSEWAIQLLHERLECSGWIHAQSLTSASKLMMPLR